ncbi:DUF1616 domain-containing protein [Halogeometricum sp. S1BR25-6]|uniref:DUF1616 domain-containing protein n=1 Tax=Halogeometricum salsisoli TaxID=2950536 RepID=A0ABU2GK18_9EURY|nr:DUF1616 domain-containing protein [Halogeometricum sp. S1BR25-6]MDS0300413.1 DUF1616 domain-containing protein [Halogeometricum sp. S1BR25-6]
MSDRAVYADVAASVAVVAVAVVAVLSLEPITARAALAGGLVLFFPGYALTTLVFPAAKKTRPEGRDLPSAFAGRTEHAGLPFLERLAMSFGLSVALVPLFAWALQVVGAEFLAPNIAAVCGGATVLGLLAGGARRLATPSDSRYVVPVSAVTEYRRAVRGRSELDGVLNVALAAAIILSAGVVTFALVSPADGARYTQASLLTETDNGTLVAADYPRNLTVGESGELVLRIENYERETVNYAVVAQLQRVRPDGTVVEASELDRFSQTVGPGSAWELTHGVAPEMTGDDLRLTYLIYRGPAPEDPDVDSSYRHVTLWMNVSDPSAAETGKLAAS